jgi:hypothetical protein
MALDAEFCSDCGVRRAVATGYESETNQISNAGARLKDEVNQNLAKGFAGIGGSFSKGQEGLSAGFRKASGLRFYLSNKFSNFGKFLVAKKKIVYVATGGMFVIASYVLIQTIIFSSQNTDLYSEKYINLVSARDTSEVSANSIYFPNPENLPVLPAKFQKWDEIEQVTWKANSNWNGWLGKATITFAPFVDQKILSDQTVELQLAAKFKTKWFIFREIDWVASNPVASIDIESKIEKDQSITFNGVSAGNSNTPVLSKQRYAILPGPISIVLNGTGFTQQREFSDFASSAGLITSEFEPIGFGLSPAQQVSASNRVTTDFENCLNRECGRLPDLYQSDFVFDNWPDDYLYVDYFNAGWEDTYTCDAPEFTVSSYESAQLSMKCSVSASASIKWILYRVWFTTYYDTGFDYREFDIYLTADLSPITGSSAVRVSGIDFSN